MKKYTKKQLIRLRVFFIFESRRRTKYIVKHKIFKSIGENFFFQPRIIPSDPEFIKFHNNVTVASGVTFITHDIIDNVLNNLGKGYFPYKSGCIEVMDNVFIGSGCTILPNIRIGSNVIIAAGSVVTKDVESNTVVGGNPAKKICTFEQYLEKRKKMKCLNDNDLWQSFEQERTSKR